MRFMAKPGHLFGSVPSYNKLEYYPQNTLDFIWVFKDFDSIFTHTLKLLSQLGPPSPYTLADAFTRVWGTLVKLCLATWERLIESLSL